MAEEKVYKLFHGALWGMIASGIVSFELVVITVASGSNPADRIIDVMIWSYIISCFIAGLIAQKLNGFGFGTGFSIALGTTFYFTLWRGQVAFFASLLAMIAAFFGIIVSAVLHFAVGRLRQEFHKWHQMALKADPARRRQYILSPPKP